MKPIRVLQVLTIMNRGGAETMIMNYYRTMDRTKVQFDFLLHREEKGAFDEEIKELGGRIFIMPAISPKNYFSYKKKLHKFFKHHKEYNIIHSHLNALSFIVLSIAATKQINVRIAHSHLAVEPYIIKRIFAKNTDIIATIKDTIQSLIKFKTPKYATHFFACSEKAGIWLFGENNSDKITIINNAIDANLFSYDSHKSANAKKLLNVEGKIVIGHVGRFNEQKNHFFLLKIFSELIKINKDFILLLVGDGNLRTSIEREVENLNIKEYVKFLGEKKEIPLILQGFDLFLFPSLYEGLPVTLIEAQAAGLKIITSTNVTKEVNITNLVKFCALTKSEYKWARMVHSEINYERRNTTKDIVNNKYDIKNNALSLQKFYINQEK